MTEPLAILIDLAGRRLHLLRDGKTDTTYPVGIGKPDTPTPVGDYEIIEKAMYPGGVFGTRWMQFWDGYGIHGTIQPELIGQMVSHGCVRMHNEDVERLYPQTPLGTPVHIVHSSLAVAARPLTPTATPPNWGLAPSPGERIQSARVSGQYMVAPGDNLWLLARRFGTTVEALATANQLVDSGTLESGQVLRLT